MSTSQYMFGQFLIFGQFLMFSQFLMFGQFLIFSQFLMFGQFLMFNQFLMFGQFLMFSQFLLFGQFLMFCQYQTGMGRITLQCSALHYNYFHKTSIILQLQLHVFWKVMHYITITLPK